MLSGVKGFVMPRIIVWIEDDIDVIDSVVQPLESAGYEFIRISTVPAFVNSLSLGY